MKQESHDFSRVECQQCRTATIKAFAVRTKQDCVTTLKKSQKPKRKGKQMDELIRLVVTSKAYTEALNSGITITMSIINGYEDMFPKSWLLVQFRGTYYLTEHVFDTEWYENMISPEIAVESKLTEMKTEVMKPVRLWE